MDFLIAVFLFFFGLIIGSFLNVIILRFDTGKGYGGRSTCFSCGKALSWIELLPMISFLFQRGKCTGCRSKISWQYPIVEFFTGLLFVLVFLFEPVAGATNFWKIITLFASFVAWASLVVIFVYDLRHMVIPEEFILVFGASALLRVVALMSSGGVDVLISHIAGALIFSLFLFSLWFFSGGKWVGFGDVELALAIGLYLGAPLSLSAIALSFWIGAIVSLIFIASKKYMGTKQLRQGAKEITMRSEIPFAPYLIIGMALAWLTGIDLFHLSYFFL
jgi:prepilin signal peptidase PulO-like enzyme (type II secretory pathway)